MFKFSDTSKRRLATCHPDLIDVAYEALRKSQVDFGIAEGSRTVARQRELVAAGASWTMNSRHIPRVPIHGQFTMPCSHAFDVYAWVGGKARWDWPLMHIIAVAIKTAAITKHIPIEWGGDWSDERKDGPHWQLPWADYPVHMGNNHD